MRSASQFPLEVPSTLYRSSDSVSTVKPRNQFLLEAYPVEHTRKERGLQEPANVRFQQANSWSLSVLGSGLLDSSNIQSLMAAGQGICSMRDWACSNWQGSQSLKKACWGLHNPRGPTHKDLWGPQYISVAVGYWDNSPTGSGAASSSYWMQESGHGVCCSWWGEAPVRLTEQAESLAAPPCCCNLWWSDPSVVEETTSQKTNPVFSKVHKS